MSNKTALIVDDSKLAQVSLKKMLVKFNLHVETANSAEDALHSLADHMPNVVFMDHHMEGMNGLEALKIIKDNPATAMIPVIMYTSQKGDVYCGQAHALGAIDTLEKDVVKPDNLQQVLARLGLAPRLNDPKMNKTDIHHPPAKPAHQTAQAQSSSKDHAHHGHHESHATKIKTQIPEITIDNKSALATAAAHAHHHGDNINELKQKVENQAYIIDRLNKRLAQLLVGKPDPAAEHHQERSSESHKANWLSGSIFSLILLALVAISVSQSRTSAHLESLDESMQQLHDLIADAQFDSALGNDRSPVASATPQAAMIDSDKLLSTLSWAAGIDTQFGFDAAPLSETQIINLQNLVFKLNESNYKGIIELTIHFGDFCVIKTRNGDYALPNRNIPADACTLMSDITQDFETKDYLSVPYVQFEQSSAPIQRGDIEVVINMAGYDSPLYTPPVSTANVRAGEWNDIAAQNNRISMKFEKF